MAGPVVAAAVALRPDIGCDELSGAFDSKTLPAERRDALSRIIREVALAFGIGAASAREIERLNIRRATAVAMRRALSRLPFEPELLLVDGLPVPELGAHRALVEGDRRSLSIACASILAKVTRDRLMVRLSRRYPEYGWESNKGYITAAHLSALRRHGPSPHHRATWAPVAQTELSFEVERCTPST
jgi:ribonuclease HII